MGTMASGPEVEFDGTIAQHSLPRDRASAAPRGRGVHIVFTCHGMMGDSTDMLPLLRALQDTELKDLSHDQGSVHFHNVLAHEPHSLWQRLTLTTRTGVAHGGTAVAHEILKVLNANQDVTSISLVGFSLGGLYMRVAAGLLLPLHPSSKRRPPHSALARSDPFQKLAQSRSIDFNAYISIATPHVGVRGLLNPLYAFVMRRGWIGQAGRDLAWDPPQTWQACAAMPQLCHNQTAPTFQDATALLKAPILLQLATPGGVYWQALALFRSRTAVGNEALDDSVPYFTAALAPEPAWLDSPQAAQLGVAPWELPRGEGDAAPLDPHFTGAWLQRSEAAATDDDALQASMQRWVAAFRPALGEGRVTPEIAQAASLRAMGGWLTVNARWDDWFAYFVNHNRIHGHKWLTPWADCAGFLRVLSRIVAHRLRGG